MLRQNYPRRIQKMTLYKLLQKIFEVDYNNFNMLQKITSEKSALIILPLLPHVSCFINRSVLWYDIKHLGKCKEGFTGKVLRVVRQ